VKPIDSRKQRDGYTNRVDSLMYHLMSMQLYENEPENTRKRPLITDTMQVSCVAIVNKPILGLKGAVCRKSYPAMAPGY
jgi:hypothetical protein